MNEVFFCDRKSFSIRTECDGRDLSVCPQLVQHRLRDQRDQTRFAILVDGDLK